MKAGLQFRSRGPAPLCCRAAPGIEGTTRRYGVQARHGAVNLPQFRLARPQGRDRSHQPGGVGMPWRARHRIDRTGLDDAPRIHDRHPVCRFGDHAHIVRHQHHRGAMIAAEPLQQRRDLGLDGHVQRGCRLVRNDEIRFSCKRESDHHALPHAARKLMGVMVDPDLGRGNSNLPQQFEGANPRFLRPHRQMGADRLRQLVANGQHRMQGCQRVLEDGADALPAKPAGSFRIEIVNAFAVQPDLAARNPAGRIEEADDRCSGQGFSCAGFPDHTEDLPRRDVETHPVEGRERSMARVEDNMEVADAEEGSAGIAHDGGDPALPHSAGPVSLRSTG